MRGFSYNQTIKDHNSIMGDDPREQARYEFLCSVYSVSDLESTHRDKMHNPIRVHRSRKGKHLPPVSKIQNQTLLMPNRYRKVNDLSRIGSGTSRKHLLTPMIQMESTISDHTKKRRSHKQLPLPKKITIDPACQKKKWVPFRESMFKSFNPDESDDYMKFGGEMLMPV